MNANSNYKNFNPNVPLTQNEDFVLFGSEDLYSVQEELVSELSNKKQELLQFFRLSSFPKENIYLFQKREDYYYFLEHHENKIAVCYSGVSKTNLFTFLKQKIIYELVHYMCLEVCNTSSKIPFWLDRGLSIYLSGEKVKLENNDYFFKEFFLDRIVRRDKEIPIMNLLNDWNETALRFLSTNRFDINDFSYLLVHYILGSQNIYDFIDNRHLLNDSFINECINYYNQKYPVVDNFYDIRTDFELMDYLNKHILYGWLDKDKKEHIDTLKGFRENYRISSIEEILNTKIGTCIEQAKIINYWLDRNGIENKIFCYRSYKTKWNAEEDIHMHCFVLFHYGDYWYHFEHSVIRRRGIRRFNSIEEALQSIFDFFTTYSMSELSEIDDIPDGLSFQEFNKYIDQFGKYEIESLKR